MKTITKISAALLVSALAVPAFAQNAPDRIVLESKAGSVMTSTGGEYATAPTGKPLVTGESMMLSDGAKATVVYYYDNGDRKCVEHYAGPNTYVIDDRCVPAAVWARTGNPMASGLIIAGAAVLGAAILDNMDKVPVGPLSAGPNGTEIDHGP